MNVWLIADTHFGHSEIIKYCNRPFSSVSEMNEKMIKNWNNLVSKQDIVYHLGDFAFGSEEYIRELVSRLNGRIRLIMGNHDSKSIKTYERCGFDHVSATPILIHEFAILSHEPIFVNRNCPFINIFGHVHDQETYKTFSGTGACVCAERTNYAPISLTDVYDAVTELREADDKITN